MIHSKRLAQLARRLQRVKTTAAREDDACCTTSPVADKGRCTMYTADGRRFKVPLPYLGTTVFGELLRMSQEEFGFAAALPPPEPAAGNRAAGREGGGGENILGEPFLGVGGGAASTGRWSTEAAVDGVEAGSASAAAGERRWWQLAATAADGGARRWLPLCSGGARAEVAGRRRRRLAAAEASTVVEALRRPAARGSPLARFGEETGGWWIGRFVEVSRWRGVGAVWWQSCRWQDWKLAGGGASVNDFAFRRGNPPEGTVEVPILPQQGALGENLVQFLGRMTTASFGVATLVRASF
uniref:Uncharacterized protein n=1 Tax=Oryza sativa subsp. japonica TaxID=39947 RepID=Q7XXM5_ORYSJ|nr:unknown protein [Oryza sativa Japonica Group]